MAIKTTEEFIEKSRQIHGDKYNYSKVVYAGVDKKVCIICPEHGEFWQIPYNHLIKGQGCPVCGKIKAIKKRTSTTDNFIKKAKEKHGNKFDYSKVEYVNNSTKVCIICPEHGELWITPANHLKEYGCSKCGYEMTKSKLRSNAENFIKKAKEVHGDKYDYSKVEYVDNKTKVCIICPEHGEFWQKPQLHIHGCGCPKCKNENLRKIKTKALKDFVNAANIKHSFKYDYSKVEYKNTNSKVCIICSEHGEFWQTPHSHLSGRGCPKCRGGVRLTSEDFVKKVRGIHGDKYDYSKVEYVNDETKVCIICPEHGEFWQKPHEHVLSCGCPKCGNSISKAENEIYEYCCSLIGEDNVIQRDRIIINPQELDIYIPSLKIGIEYNGLKWHSDEFKKDKNAHLDKLNKCKERGIKLIQIFEDEYVNNKDIVLSKIRHLLGVDSSLPRIMARKCVVKEIDYKTAKQFLDLNHIQGGSASTVYLGAFYGDKLVGVMSFKKETKNGNNWELTRFATDNSYICQGMGGKLFSYFVKNYGPYEVKSFADRRWTVDEQNNVYIKIGLKFDKYVSPDYRYFSSKNRKNRQHKFGFRKQILHKKYGLSLSMTENEMTKELGYFKIWDCGLIKYVWRSDN